MKRAALLGLMLALCGCSEAIRISVAAGRVVCGALGCPCNREAAPRGLVGFDVLPDGGVRAVYQ